MGDRSNDTNQRSEHQQYDDADEPRMSEQARQRVFDDLEDDFRRLERSNLVEHHIHRAAVELSAGDLEPLALHRGRESPT